MTPPNSGAEHVRTQLSALARLAETAATDLAPQVATVVQRVLDVIDAGGKLMFAGNGGSSADAQHLAADYVVRFSRERRPLPALALTADTSILTAESNDRGFETVFSRQVLALGRAGDLLILHSTSGESENLLRAAAAARRVGVGTIALVAKGGGRLRDAVDLCLVLPTDHTGRAQEVQLALGHIICDLVEHTVQGREASMLERLLREGRVRELDQAAFYRRFSADAERDGDEALAERINGLLADEQHHVSRLTARLLEFGFRPDERSGSPVSRDRGGEVGTWWEEAERREAAEVRWYEDALEQAEDAQTVSVFRQILESERNHLKELGGKWMSASARIIEQESK